MFSQNETINWYFGNKAGIKFENGRIINLDNSEMNAPANCTSISDENGQLMFYSDGATVWNRNHEIMKFGTGLIGQTSHYQSVIIVPKPNSNKIYYLIYTRSESVPSLSYNPGTYYSEIEFNAENPLGIVNTKNFLLNKNAPSEKLTAVHHKDGNSFWLLTLNAEDEDNSSPKKIFNLFKIDETGINTTPTEIIANEEIENLGVMKFSPDGKKLAISANTNNDSLKRIIIYDFNTETGDLTYSTVLIVNQGLALFPSNGIEFSPNGKYMYVSISNGTRLVQYEMSDLDFGTDPKTYLFSSSNPKIESLQIGNDQKIYVAFDDGDEGYGFLGVIENPDEKGVLANYRHNAVRLSPNASKRGLPNFIQSYFASKITTENVCYVDEFSFSATSFASISNISWDFGDGTTANGINVKHTYSSPGSYTVSAILNIGSQNITVYKQVRAFELPILIANQELVECDEDLDGLSTFNLLNIRDKILSRGSTDISDFYLSQADISSNSKISNPENFQNIRPNQEIFVKVTNENGCFETTSFFLRTRFVSLGNIENVYICEDSDGIIGNAEGEFDTFILENSIRNQLGLASSLRLSFHPTFQEAQTNTNKYTGLFNEKSRTIFLKVLEADLSCGGIKPFNIVVNSEPKINLEEVYTICFIPSSKPAVIISADSSNDSYEWRNSAGNIISTSQNFTLTSIGEFSLTVYKTENNLRCSNSKTFQVVNPTPPEFSQIIVNTEDETNNIIEVFINGNSLYEFSLDNINFSGSVTSFTFSNVASGLRTVFVRDINSCEEPIQRTVSVIGYKKYFTPNGDGDNDFWNIEGLDSNSFKSIKVVIFDRFGKVIASITDFTTPGWDGSFNGKNLPANNYWFTSEIIDKDDNVIKKSGNFSLIRN
ncbi:T9SS type B sorting domain-containing protein [Polaribacter sp. BAL334]|uniref:T9SS type B sorting domain-containing protein n=1 Tax=Polaribacter sp. BAL334 TaxID=1708178 RepID=UPI0018D24DE0|nr:T9SS type B sorting domain-containing protein [Polaribacter sp. BAL334]MBG7613002.1 T9SS type B sorting domain-containing protein [Polaribacter sp. BAL334]